MDKTGMVVKGNRDPPNLQGLAHSLNPVPASVPPTFPPRRIHHFHKLEKKLSSSDLHSRLKTRKVLGVGETDDGDVHRSKLSQILGHSDQLYVRLPWGLKVWQFVLALSFTVVSLWAIILPSHIFDVTFETDDGKYVTLPVRLYGTALLALSLFHWNTIQCNDRDVIRVALLSSIVYFTLQTLVTIMTLPDVNKTNTKILLGFRVTSAVLSAIYYHVVGGRTVPFKPRLTDPVSCPE